MIIKNTDGSHCAIKDTKIYGNKAFITLIIYSSVPQTTGGNRVFNFYLRDFDKNTLLPESNNNYWIDRCINYNNDNNNIDINLYKEIILEIDISNLNTSEMLENKWVRHCSIVLIDATTKEEVWESSKLELMSKEIVLPEIKNFNIKKYNNILTANFNLNYLIQEDFNYNNDNLQLVLKTKSIYTNETIENSGQLSVKDLTLNPTDTITYSFINNYSDPVIIQIDIINLKGSVLKSFTKLVTNNIKMFIKDQTTKTVSAVNYINKDIKNISTITKK